MTQQQLVSFSSSSSSPLLAMVSTPNQSTNNKPPPTPLSKYSKSIPFLRRPPNLDGTTYAGDVGFDPFNFSSSSPEQLVYYREAEMKHSRLAMLAAAGWPISELLDKKLAGWLDMDSVLGSDDRVPSILNGGMDNVSPIWWGFCLGLAAAIDLRGIQNSRYSNNDDESDNDKVYQPGDYGFDPLGLYPDDLQGQQRMQLAEIKHGRLAMIAITAFAFQEYVSKVGIVDETPIFFHPLQLF
jgi:hypothetical protein